jgi:hypothetical protein
MFKLKKKIALFMDDYSDFFKSPFFEEKISAGSYKFPAPFAVLGENLIYVDVFGGRNILKFNFETKFNILKLIILIGS